MCAYDYTHLQLGHNHESKDTKLHLSDSDRETGLHVGQHRVVDGANRRWALRGCATRRRITEA
jgi:hypothetical protein